MHACLINQYGVYFLFVHLLVVLLSEAHTYIHMYIHDTSKFDLDRWIYRIRYLQPYGHNLNKGDRSESVRSTYIHMHSHKTTYIYIYSLDDSVCNMLFLYLYIH